MPDSLQPHGLKHTRLPCPSTTPRACSNSCPSSQWCHLTISSSQPPPLLLPPSVFPNIRVFSNNSVLHIRWPKFWSFNISPCTEYSGLISLGLTGLILLSKGLSRVFFKPQFKTSILWHSVFFMVQLSHPYVTTGKTIALTRQTFVSKVYLC